MNNGFPEYIPANEIRRRKNAETISNTLRSEEEFRQKKLATYRALFKVLPILLKDARGEATPIEIPKHFWGTRVIAGWVVDIGHSPAGNGGWGDQEAGVHPYVLTEENTFGCGSYVDRGIQAVKLWQRPDTHSPQNTSPLGLEYARTALGEFFTLAGVDIGQHRKS